MRFEHNFLLLRIFSGSKNLLFDLLRLYSFFFFLVGKWSSSAFPYRWLGHSAPPNSTIETADVLSVPY